MLNLMRINANYTDCFWRWRLLGRGCLTWVPREPSIHITRLNLLEPQGAVPQAITLLYRLAPKTPFFRRMPTGSKSFLELPDVTRLRSCVRTLLKKGLVMNSSDWWNVRKIPIRISTKVLKQIRKMWDVIFNMYIYIYDWLIGIGRTWNEESGDRMELVLISGTTTTGDWMSQNYTMIQQFLYHLRCIQCLKILILFEMYRVFQKNWYPWVILYFDYCRSDYFRF